MQLKGPSAVAESLSLEGVLACVVWMKKMAGDEMSAPCCSRAAASGRTRDALMHVYGRRRYLR